MTSIEVPKSVLLEFNTFEKLLKNTHLISILISKYFYLSQKKKKKILRFADLVGFALDQKIPNLPLATVSRSEAFVLCYGRAGETLEETNPISKHRWNTSTRGVHAGPTRDARGLCSHPSLTMLHPPPPPAFLLLGAEQRTAYGTAGPKPFQQIFLGY